MMESIRVIESFVQLVTRRDSCFSQNAFDDFSILQLSLSNLKDPPNFVIANAILDWCDRHSGIKEEVFLLAHRQLDLTPERIESQLINYQPGNSNQTHGDILALLRQVLANIQQYTH
ncbi:MAG: hypothetical protein HC796_05905 [Synechococcaceae cyanobacterium RL_1_2]|nr:hypothetical protein [Synechococcaceae cyanobacterium RL_1_2]